MSYGVKWDCRNCRDGDGGGGREPEAVVGGRQALLCYSFHFLDLVQTIPFN